MLVMPPMTERVIIVTAARLWFAAVTQPHALARKAAAPGSAFACARRAAFGVTEGERTTVKGPIPETLVENLP
jgi:hypothetical protein